MLLKKYKIGRVGIIYATYKRIKIPKNADQKFICSVCGLKNWCKNYKIKRTGTNESSSVTYYSICNGMEIILTSNSFRATDNITYVPFKSR